MHHAYPSRITKRWKIQEPQVLGGVWGQCPNASLQIKLNHFRQLGFAEDIRQLEAIVKRGIRTLKRDILKHRQGIADENRVALKRILSKFVGIRAIVIEHGVERNQLVARFQLGQTAHGETVVLLSHKKADSYIHIDVEFGEGEGKIPVDSIAKRAEAYKPKEKVTYKMIKEYIEAKYGFKVHTAYIAEVKRNLGLPMYDAPNAVEELKQPRKHPTPEKVEAIKDALRYFAVI